MNESIANIFKDRLIEPLEVGDLTLYTMTLQNNDRNSLDRRLLGEFGNRLIDTKEGLKALSKYYEIPFFNLESPPENFVSERKGLLALNGNGEIIGLLRYTGELENHNAHIVTADIIRLDYQGKGIAGDLCEKFVISSLSLNPSLVIVGEILWNNIPGIASQRKVMKRESFALNGITAEEIYDVDRRLHIFTYRKMNP